MCGSQVGLVLMAVVGVHSSTAQPKYFTRPAPYVHLGLPQLHPQVTSQTPSTSEPHWHRGVVEYFEESHEDDSKWREQQETHSESKPSRDWPDSWGQRPPGQNRFLLKYDVRQRRDVEVLHVDTETSVLHVQCLQGDEAVSGDSSNGDLYTSMQSDSTLTVYFDSADKAAAVAWRLSHENFKVRNGASFITGGLSWGCTHRNQIAGGGVEETMHILREVYPDSVELEILGADPHDQPVLPPSGAKRVAAFIRVRTKHTVPMAIMDDISVMARTNMFADSSELHAARTQSEDGGAAFRCTRHSIGPTHDDCDQLLYATNDADVEQPPTDSNIQSSELVTDKLDNMDSDRRQLFISWLARRTNQLVSGAINAVTTVASTAVSVVSTAANFVQGNANVDRRQSIGSLSWNYASWGGPSQESLNMFGTSAASCYRCFFAANLDAVVVFQSQNWAVQNAVGALSGSLHAGAGIRAVVQQQLDIERSFNVATIPTGSFMFMAGPVPITVSLAIPITVGVDAFLSGFVSASFGAEYAAWATAGMQWNRASGWQRIQSFDDTFDVQRSMAASMEGAMTAWVQPGLQLTLNALLHLNLNLRTGVLFAVQAQGFWRNRLRHRRHLVDTELPDDDAFIDFLLNDSYILNDGDPPLITLCTSDADCSTEGAICLSTGRCVELGSTLEIANMSNLQTTLGIGDPGCSNDDDCPADASCGSCMGWHDVDDVKCCTTGVTVRSSLQTCTFSKHTIRITNSTYAAIEGNDVALQQAVARDLLLDCGPNLVWGTETCPTVRIDMVSAAPMTGQDETPVCTVNKDETNCPGLLLWEADAEFGCSVAQRVKVEDARSLQACSDACFSSSSFDCAFIQWDENEEECILLTDLQQRSEDDEIDCSFLVHSEGVYVLRVDPLATVWIQATVASGCPADILYAMETQNCFEDCVVVTGPSLDEEAPTDASASMGSRSLQQSSSWTLSMPVSVSVGAGIGLGSWRLNAPDVTLFGFDHPLASGTLFTRRRLAGDPSPLIESDLAADSPSSKSTDFSGNTLLPRSLAETQVPWIADLAFDGDVKYQGVRQDDVSENAICAARYGASETGQLDVDITFFTLDVLNIDSLHPQLIAVGKHSWHYTPDWASDVETSSNSSTSVENSTAWIPTGASSCFTQSLYIFDVDLELNFVNATVISNESAIGREYNSSNFSILPSCANGSAVNFKGFVDDDGLVLSVVDDSGCTKANLAHKDNDLSRGKCECPVGHYNPSCGSSELDSQIADSCQPCAALPVDFYYFSSGGSFFDGCQAKRCIDTCPPGYFLKGCGQADPGTCEPCSNPLGATSHVRPSFIGNGGLRDLCVYDAYDPHALLTVDGFSMESETFTTSNAAVNEQLSTVDALAIVISLLGVIVVAGVVTISVMCTQRRGTRPPLSTANSASIMLMPRFGQTQKQALPTWHDADETSEF